MKQPEFLLKHGKNIRKNIGIKIISISLAFLAWFFIVSFNDPERTLTFPNIPVTLLNEDIITNQGKAWQILEGSESVTVTVHARRSIATEIRSDLIVVTADIAQMNLESLVPLEVSVQGFDANVRATVNPNNLYLSIENIERITFPIITRTIGNPHEGYMIGEVFAAPDSITLIGPETLMDSVGRVEAQVSVAAISSTVSLEAEIIIYDQYDNEMSQALFLTDFEETVFYVVVEILETKDVPIVFGELENVPDGYIVTNVSSEPQYLTVAGSVEDLESLEEIMIPSDSFELESVVGVDEITLDVRPYLPEGITLADEDANVIVVSVAVERAGTRTIELPTDTITILGLTDELVASFEEEDTIVFMISGQQRIIDDLDLRNYVSIDLSGFTGTGTINVPVLVELPFNVRVIGTVIVQVTLDERVDFIVSELEEGVMGND